MEDWTTTLGSAAIEQAGARLWQAWCEHSQLDRPTTDDAKVVTIGDGYAIQDALVKASGHRIVGWKIGATNRAAQQMLGLPGPVSGRLLEPFCYVSPAQIPSADFAMRALEPEIAFRMAVDLPSRDPAYTNEEVAHAVALAYPALEIPDTRLRAWDRAGAPTFIADNSVAGRFVLGNAVPNWRSMDLKKIAVKLIVNDDIVATGTGRDVLGDPLNALAWLANHLSRRGTCLRAGDLVTTGTCTPIGFADPGAVVIADFGPFGSSQVKFS